MRLRPGNGAGLYDDHPDPIVTIRTHCLTPGCRNNMPGL